MEGGSLMSAYSNLKHKFLNKTADIGVIGLGYVGLPLCMEMVRGGFTVYGIDLDSHKVESLQNGKSYIQDVPSAEVAAAIQTGRFMPTDNYHTVQRLDAICICVPTPLSENQD